MKRLSTRLVHAIKLDPEPAYKKALRAGLWPSQLSRFMHHAERVREDDPRLIQVGRELGLEPQDCFEPVMAESTAA